MWWWRQADSLSSIGSDKHGLTLAYGSPQKHSLWQVNAFNRGYLHRRSDWERRTKFVIIHNMGWLWQVPTCATPQRSPLSREGITGKYRAHTLLFYTLANGS